jgi:transcriptional regulator with XRE-family HTH domain
MLATETSSAYGPNMKLSDGLRRAIETSGFSRYRIAKETGVSQAALSRFCSGERGLTLDGIDRIAEFLNIRLCSSKAKPRKGR